MRRIILPLTGILIVFLLWEALIYSNIASQNALPSPLTVLQTFFQTLSDGTLLNHAFSSFVRITIGFGLSALIAVPFGILMGTNRTVNEMFDPIVKVLTPIPGIAWIPLAIVWFGMGLYSTVFIIFMGAFFPILLNTVGAVRAVDEYLINASRTLGASNLDILRHVILPGSLPGIITGFRVGMGTGWRAVVGAEMLSTAVGGFGYFGLGRMIIDAQYLYRMDLVIIGMITMGLIGYALERLVFRSLEVRTVEKWKMISK